MLLTRECVARDCLIGLFLLTVGFTCIYGVNVNVFVNDVNDIVEHYCHYFYYCYCCYYCYCHYCYCSIYFIKNFIDI